MKKTLKFDNFVNETLSSIPGSKNSSSDEQILRAAILAELDTINLYEQMADEASDSKIKETLLNVAREEKTHIGEFQTLLKEIDTEFADELKNGKREVEKEEKNK